MPPPIIIARLITLSAFLLSREALVDEGAVLSADANAIPSRFREAIREIATWVPPVLP